MFCFRCRSWQRIELAGSKAQKALMLSLVFFFSFQFKMWQKYWISRGRPVPGRNIRFHLWNKLSNLASVAPIVGRSYWEISCNTQYHTFCRSPAIVLHRSWSVSAFCFFSCCISFLHYTHQIFTFTFQFSSNILSLSLVLPHNELGLRV